MNTLRRRAFTLIEVLIVVIVIAVLTAVVVPKVVGAVSQSRVSSQNANVDQLNNALLRIQADSGACPADASKAASWMTSSTRPSDWPTGAYWNGPYLNTATIPNNPTTGAAFNFDATICRFSP